MNDFNPKLRIGLTLGQSEKTLNPHQVTRDIIIYGQLSAHEIS